MVEEGRRVSEPVTHWEWECDQCSFRMRLPMTADDRNGDYALDIVITHMQEHDPDDV